jgi:hypothetical protein
MSKELEARVERLEAVILGLLDELLEMKSITYELGEGRKQEQRAFTQNQLTAQQQQIDIQIRQQQAMAALQNAQAQNALLGAGSTSAFEALPSSRYTRRFLGGRR